MPLQVGFSGGSEAELLGYAPVTKKAVRLTYTAFQADTSLS